MEEFVISISNSSDGEYVDIYRDPADNKNFHPSATTFITPYSAQYVRIYRQASIITICEVHVFSGKYVSFL